MAILLGNMYAPQSCYIAIQLHYFTCHESTVYALISAFVNEAQAAAPELARWNGWTWIIPVIEGFAKHPGIGGTSLSLRNTLIICGV